jgi:cytochrome P450
LKAILAIQSDSFDLGSARHRAFSPFLGDGIFTVSGEAWANARHLLKGNFSRVQIKAMLGPLSSKASKLMETISDGKTVDLQPLFLKLTMDSATDFLFGYSTSEYPHGQAFSEAFEVAQRGLAIRARLGLLNSFYTDKKFSEACKVIHRFVDELIDIALAHRTVRNSDRYVFLYALASQVGHDRKLLRDHVLNLLVAGRDTTAGLLSITFFLLARHKDVWLKLQDEVKGLAAREPDFDQLKAMVYLPRVLKEGRWLFCYVARCQLIHSSSSSVPCHASNRTTS